MKKMKKIVLTQKNLAKIDELIKTVEGRSTARTITAEKILKAVTRLESQLDVRKSALTGLEIDLDLNAQNFPRAYKFVPMSTQVSLVRTASSWTITHIWRSRTQKCGQGITFLVVPQTTKDAVLERTFRGVIL